MVSIGYDGELDVTRGLIAPADMKAAKAEPGSDRERRGRGGQRGSRSGHPPGLSKAVADDLTAQRTAALRAVIAGNMPVALVALAQALGVAAVLSGLCRERPEVRAVSPALRGEGIDDNRGSKDMTARMADWAQPLPEASGGVWDWLITLDQPTLLDLIGLLRRRDGEAAGWSADGPLAAAAKLDLAQWWAPTAKGYFSRVSKAQIAEAVTEGVNAQAAANIASLKKVEMAERAEALLAATGWLPPLVRG